MPGIYSPINPHFPAVSRVIPFAAFMLFVGAWEFAGDYWTRLGIDARWLFAVRTVVVMVLLGVFWRGYTEVRRFALSWREVLVAVLTGLAVFVMWINLDFSWATFGETRPFNPTNAGGGIDLTMVAFRLFGMALVVPLMEELFWRSFVMRWIDQTDFLELPPGTVSLRAIAVSSVLFGCEHQLWMAGLIAGLIYAFLYVRTGNLWMPVISHGVTNAVLGLWIVATGNWQFW